MVPNAPESSDAAVQTQGDSPATSAKVKLTVTEPFLSYSVGAVITSAADIKVALEKFAHCVVKTAASD